MKKIIWVVLVAMLVIGATLAVKKKIGSNAAIEPLSSYDVMIKTFTPKEVNATLTTPVLAFVKNDHDATLGSKVSAGVVFIAPAGTAVKKGDVVVRLDNNDLLAQREAAKLSLNNEIASHQRSLELYSVKGVSIEQLQNEESRIATLKAELERISNLISYTVICSPVDGVVGETFVAPGEVAPVGKPLASIRASRGSYLWVRLPLGLNAKELIFEAHRAPLRFLQNSNGANEYRSDIPISLPSGSRVEAKVVTFEGNGVFLPREALLFKESKAYVLVVNGHKAKAMEVNVIAKGDEGYVVSGAPLQKVALAKSDILLKIMSGASLTIKE